MYLCQHDLQTPRSPTEPRNPEAPKKLLNFEKCVFFGPPRKKNPKVNQNDQNDHFSDILMDLFDILLDIRCRRSGRLQHDLLGLQIHVGT